MTSAPFKRSGAGIVALSLAMCVATLMLVWFGWRAARQLQRDAELRMARRTEATSVLLRIALNRDMTGAWVSVLVPIERAQIASDPPYDFMQETAGAFARFSYVESFLVWNDDGSAEGRVDTFNRADRDVPWAPVRRSDVAYPVVLDRNPPGLKALVADVRQRAGEGTRFALIRTSVDGLPYQAVVHFIFADRGRRLRAFVAFLVNIDWVRQHYFDELLAQVASLAGAPEELSLSIRDARGVLVARHGGTPGDGSALKQSFPMLFLRQSLARGNGEAPMAPDEEWTAWVQPSAHASAEIRLAGRQNFFTIAAAAISMLLALLLVLRAARARAELATMKSEFVSAVTHELKTPLALIRLVAETLERGRYTSGETIREYATLLSKETSRLGHLIDNLLTYSRLSDVRQVYTFEDIEVQDLIEDALDQFRPRLKELGFQLSVDIAANLPAVRADRAAMSQVLENLVDNAIKYSNGRRELAVTASRAPEDHEVAIRVRDAGPGIPADDLARVFEKFYRGRGVKASGSGLGLSIARRVVEGHGGRIELSSRIGDGTTVDVRLPEAEQA